ncbi:hypothetical protein SVAN01_08634 [Stagonosporopsis vannaccii]|nr:hypothetical protein SVAN01_08634 [Stagonosporopsis vannaccii]
MLDVRFLLAEQLERVSNPGKTNMPSKFRYVCQNPLSRPEVQPIALASTVRRLSTRTKTQATSGDHNRYIKQEDIEEYDTASVGSTSESSKLPAEELSTPSPMPNRLASSTAQIKLSASDLDHSSEIWQLNMCRAARATLKSKDWSRAMKFKPYEVLRTEAAEESRIKEMEKRRRAEEQVENLQSQIATLKKSLSFRTATFTAVVEPVSSQSQTKVPLAIHLSGQCASTNTVTTWANVVGPQALACSSLTMDVKDSYTLEDFKIYAHKEFPLEFEIQNVPLLHISLWYHQQHGTRVWALSHNSTVRYFYGRPGQALVVTRSPFQDEGRTLLKAFKGPFAYMPSHKRLPSNKKNEIKELRALIRKRKAFLIQLSVLVAEYVDRLVDTEKKDLLAELKDLCIYLHKNKVKTNLTSQPDNRNGARIENTINAIPTGGSSELPPRIQSIFEMFVEERRTEAEAG